MMIPPTGNNPAAGPCGLLRRLAAIVYDSLLVAGLWMIATAILVLIIGGAVAPRSLPFQLFLLLIAWGYFAVFWIRGGQTPGMRAWHIFITAEDGGRVDPRATLIRFFVAWLSALAVGAGFFWSLGRPDRAAWHDLASGTRLVVDREAYRRRNSA